MRAVMDTNVFVSGIFWEGNFCSQIIEKELWGGHFWTEGGHIDTVGDGYGEKQMKQYIENQGRDSSQLKLTSFIYKPLFNFTKSAKITGKSPKILF